MSFTPENDKPSKMRWLIGAAAVLLAVVIGKTIGGLAGREAVRIVSTADRPAPSLEAIVTFMASEARGGLPRRFDDMAMTDVRAAGRSLTYVYRLDQGVAVQSAGDLIRHLRTSVCGSRMGDLVRRGATIEYEYWSATGGIRPEAKIPISYCP